MGDTMGKQGLNEEIFEEEKRKEEEYETAFVEPRGPTESVKEKLEETAREEDLPLDYENIYYVSYCKNYPRVRIYEYQYPDGVNVTACFDGEENEVVALSNGINCRDFEEWIEYKKWKEEQEEKVKKYIA